MIGNLTYIISICAKVLVGYRMAASENPKTQFNYISGHIWFMVHAGSLEGMGVLFSDRLALSGAPCTE